MRKLNSKSLRFIPAALGLVSALVANNASAANQYFDVNGVTAGYGVVNGGSYSWDDPNWAAASGGTSATANWVAGNFPRFNGGVSGNSYTVTVNADESMAGMFNTVAGVTLNINGAGAGTLDVVSGDQGFIATGSVVINAVISGAGAVAPEGAANLYLYGNNTYSGGTAFGYSGAPLTYFNNNNSFGSGAIRLLGTAANFQALLSTGGSTITLANGFVNSTTGTGLNFASGANTPVVSTGNWSLGVNTLNLRNSGDSTAPLTISGVISGTGNLSLSANNSGKIILSGANTYTGTTTVGVGTTPVTLQLGAANAIASSSSLIMSGCTFNPGGFSQAMAATTLGLTANSTIDFGAGASALKFANSSSLTWSGVLNLANWNPALDSLEIGTDGTGLTSTQLADIEVNGAYLGTAEINSSGYISFVPEPSTALLGLLGGLGVMWTIRRRTA